MLCLQKTTFFYLIVLVERGAGVDVGPALPHLNGHSIVFNATWRSFGGKLTQPLNDGTGLNRTQR